MKLNDPAPKEDVGPAGQEAKFSREINAIIDKHERRFLSRIHKPRREVFSSDEAYEQRNKEFARELEKCERELRQVRFHLLEDRPIDFDDTDELREMITDKLAVGSMNRAHPSDWWWTPADASFQGLLKEVQQTLQGDSPNRVRLPGRIFFYSRLVLAELVYLGIVVGLFSVANSRFERSVFAGLVMIYNSVAYTGSAIYRGAYSLMWRTEKAYGDIGRALRLKIPVSSAREAEKALRESRIAFVIHLASITIASLIALWHLVTAMLP